MRWSWAADLLPGVLDAVLEGSGLMLVYLMASILLRMGDVYLDTPEFALLAGLGLVLARRPILGLRGGALVVPAAIAAGIGGWLVAPAARDALGSGDVPRALTMGAAGWLCGVAVLRGAQHSDPASDDLVASRVLGLGLPCLALAWLFAQVTPAAVRAAFTAPAFVATLTFVTTALLAVAVARIRALGIISGFDWRANRPWLAVLGSVVLVAVLVAVPLAALIGLPIDAAVRGALGPIGVVVFGLVAILTVPAGLIVLGLESLTRMTPTGPQLTPVPGVAPPYVPAVQAETSSSLPGLVVVTAIALVVLGVALFLAWRVRRSPGSERRQTTEDRRIVVPDDALRIGVPSLRWRPRTRPGTPREAVGAYLALLRDIRDVPRAARGDAETPAAHASRLRQTGGGDLQLDLLAADYELVRYAGRTLSTTENRRAVFRWRALREHLRT